MARGRGGRKRTQARGGFGQTVIGEELRIGVNLALKNFRESEGETELQLPSSFLSTERAYVHKLATEMGLQSKSRGKGQARYLTVFKKERSTIVAKDAVLELSEGSLRLIRSLLSRHPVSARERVEQVPSSEKMIGKSVMGRLGGGVPQVPPSPASAGGEYLEGRRGLPIWGHRREVVEAMRSSQVVLVTGDTGSGKTTQVPQFVMEEAAEAGHCVRVVCCQPRRLTAVTVAERVACERGEKVGGTVGYQIRLESCVSPRTVATFCTYGVLLRSLMGGDAVLSSLTHIVVDEIHEREAMSDFLVTVLRDALARHRNLRLVLMSATVDTEQFINYFPGCVHVSLEGKMFPVEEIYLENVLSMTNYSTREMERLKQSGMSSSSTVSMKELTVKLAMMASDDVVIEDAKQAVALPEMDDILSKCFLIGTEEHFSCLAAVLSREEGETDLVNYRHSTTGVTSLMVGASRGRLDMVELALQMGAECQAKLSNGWTALECARQQGQEECVRLLEQYQAVVEGVVMGGGEVVTTLSDEEKEVLELYQGTVDSDRVDHDLVLHLLVHIHTQQGEGAVLVFLPGYEDIAIVRDLIGQQAVLSRDTTVVVLHSQVASGEHRKAFQPAARGRRKVVLATNVAETGITLSDVVFVIDSGKAKLKTYDALTNTTMLKSEWISQTSSTQRKGRAGRCQAGQVYRLYSSTRHSAMSQFTIPEILRTPLLSLCLQTKLLAPPNTPIADFLARVPDPPPFLITRNAVQALKSMEALDPWEDVTPLGSHLLDIPLDPWLGKILLHGVILKCLDPILTITCTLAYRNPFVLPLDQAGKKSADLVRLRLAAETGSDHMAMLRAFQEWQLARMEGREKRWCKANMVSSSTMEMVVGMRNQVLAQLRASGFVRARGSGDIRDINSNSDNWGLVKACMVAGLYPNLVRVDREGGVMRTQKESKVRIQPGSVVGKAMNLRTDWLVYEEMTRVGRTAYVRGVTPVCPAAVALFGGPSKLSREGEGGGGNLYLEESSDSEVEEVDNSSSSSVVMVDSWTVFTCSEEVAMQVMQLRQKWFSLWIRRLSTTSKQARIQEEQDDAVISSIAALLQLEEQSLGLAQPHGIGQRPKQMAVDLSTGQPTQQVDRRRQSDSMSTTSEEEMVQSPPTRYFIVKPSAGSLTALEAAMSHTSGVWSFPTTTERKLLTPVTSGQMVVAIFSVASSGAFQGCGVFTGQQGVEGGRSGVRMEWLASKGVSFTSTQVSHITNKMDEGRRLQTARDGQELDQEAAGVLLQAMGVNSVQGRQQMWRGGRKERHFR
eukprot:GFUD01000866.1.p1 GENE.GFUD01000866.1~~GFUD01000866.1.p1  ORF type:complete len:1316 (+),score=569.14 GFUD01000866.1:71-3949(+)